METYQTVRSVNIDYWNQIFTLMLMGHRKQENIRADNNTFNFFITILVLCPYFQKKEFWKDKQIFIKHLF